MTFATECTSSCLEFFISSFILARFTLRRSHQPGLNLLLPLVKYHGTLDSTTTLHSQGSPIPLDNCRNASTSLSRTSQEGELWIDHAGYNCRPFRRG